MKKMQSLMAIAAKLIRVFYAMLTKGVDYDPKKMVSDIKRPRLDDEKRSPRHKGGADSAQDQH